MVSGSDRLFMDIVGAIDTNMLDVFLSLQVLLIYILCGMLSKLNIGWHYM